MAISDTTLAAQQAQVAAVQRLGCEGRMRVAAQMSEDARALSVAGVRRRNPDLSREEALRAVLSGLYGERIAAACTLPPETG
jgi:hypothetical protein